MRTAFVVLSVLYVTGTAWADGAATQMLNTFRAEKGRAALTWSAVLEQAAARHGQDMVANGFFSHTGSNGSSIGQRVKAVGYQWCFVAENIAQGQRSLTDVMQAWAGSPGHRKNMLHRKARQFGLARGAGNTWVMVLAAPC